MCLGIPGQILTLPAAGTYVATVFVSGVRRMVDISIVLDDHPTSGAWVVVHGGFALSMISEEEALETLAVLDEMANANVITP